MNTRCETMVFSNVFLLWCDRSMFVACEWMKLICMSMPVCVHSCTVTEEYTERFTENEDDNYEDEKLYLHLWNYTILQQRILQCNSRKNKEAYLIKYQISFFIVAFTVHNQFHLVWNWDWSTVNIRCHFFFLYWWLKSIVQRMCAFQIFYLRRHTHTEYTLLILLLHHLMICTCNNTLHVNKPRLNRASFTATETA